MTHPDLLLHKQQSKRREYIVHTSDMRGHPSFHDTNIEHALVSIFLKSPSDSWRTHGTRMGEVTCGSPVVTTRPVHTIHNNKVGYLTCAQSNHCKRENCTSWRALATSRCWPFAADTWASRKPRVINNVGEGLSPREWSGHDMAVPGGNYSPLLTWMQSITPWTFVLVSEWLSLSFGNVHLDAWEKCMYVWMHERNRLSKLHNTHGCYRGRNIDGMRSLTVNIERNATSMQRTVFNGALNVCRDPTTKGSYVCLCQLYHHSTGKQPDSPGRRRPDILYDGLIPQSVRRGDQDHSSLDVGTQSL